MPIALEFAISLSTIVSSLLVGTIHVPRLPNMDSSYTQTSSVLNSLYFSYLHA